jgi:hypothetical protein
MAALFERLARNAEERVASERASRRLLPAPPARRLIAAPDGKDTGHNGTSITMSGSGFWSDWGCISATI